MIGLVKGTMRSIVKPSSAPIVTFRTNCTLPLSRFIANITPVQAGSGDPSPSNPRVITGWSEVNVCDTPMPVSQLWTIDSSFNGTVNFNQGIVDGNFLSATNWMGENATISVNNNELLITATSTSGGQGTFTRGTASTQWVVGHKVLAMCDVKSSTTGFTVRMSLAYNTQVKNVVGTITISSSWQTLSGVCDISEATKGTRICSTVSALAIDGTMSVRNVKAIDLTQMFGSTIADYIYALEQNETGAGVAFFKSIYPNDYYDYDTGTNEMVGSREGQTATINLGGTYYGFTHNVGTGLLTKTWSDKITIDGSESVYSVSQSGSGIYYIVARDDLTGIATTSTDKTVISDKMKTETGAVADNRCYIVGGRRLVCVLSDQTITTKSQANQWFTDNPCTFIYELATPVEYQLTPAQLTQLLGENNVWSDSGDSEVDFFRRNAYFGR